MVPFEKLNYYVCLVCVIKYIFLDLPADTPLTDLSKLADLDMKKLPDPEESGDRCIRKIQEFLIHEMSHTECGVLSEDKLQRLLVGVSTFYFPTDLATNSSLLLPRG